MSEYRRLECPRQCAQPLQSPCRCGEERDTREQLRRAGDRVGLGHCHDVGLAQLVWCLSCTHVSRGFSVVAASLTLTMTYTRSHRTCHRTTFMASPKPFLPGCIAPPFRYALRYYTKQRQHRQNVPPKTKQYTTKNRDARLASMYRHLDAGPSNGMLESGTTGKTPDVHVTTDLAFLLGQYPIYTSTVDNLHYTDMKTLLSVSKSIHNVIVSTSESYEKLRNSTCDLRGKFRCWGCGSRVCAVGLPLSTRNITMCLYPADLIFKQDCRSCRIVGDPDTSSHLRFCLLRCSKCFYTDPCHSRRRGSFWSPPACQGHRNSSWRIANRLLCQTCFPRPLSEIVGTRQARERRKMDRQGEAETRCGVCRIQIAAKGPRWWVCQLCESECTSCYHSLWVT